jgi:hypothetical protein
VARPTFSRARVAFSPIASTAMTWRSGLSIAEGDRDGADVGADVEGEPDARMPASPYSSWGCMTELIVFQSDVSSR